MMSLLNILRRIFCKEYPIWSYGLECNICKMSFPSAEMHYKHVIESGTESKHEGKIPKLK